MPFNNQADFGEFNLPKSRKNNIKPHDVADIISQAEEIVNAYALKKDDFCKPNHRRFFPFAVCMLIAVGIAALVFKIL